MKEICTVLLISYNHKNYIEKAINSVLSQKTNFLFRIDIFDDGSKDGTKRIIKEYVKKYPKLIHAHFNLFNRGSEYNFLKAYKSVRTKYFAILEGDDYYCDDTKLEEQISALEANPQCSFCAHQTLIKNLNDPYRNFADNKPLVTNEEILNKNIVSYDDINKLEKGFINHLSSRVIRKNCVDFKKLKYKQSFLFDNCQFYYLLLKGPMYFINKTMSVYNQTGEGEFSSRPWESRLRRCLEVLHAFNKETDFVITDRIYKEMINFSEYYARIARGALEKTSLEELQKTAKLYYKKAVGE